MGSEAQTPDSPGAYGGTGAQTPGSSGGASGIWGDRMPGSPGGQGRGLWAGTGARGPWTPGLSAVPAAAGDVTELWWAPALRQGHGLELSGSIVTVRQAGLYLVYSQVLFHDPTFTMGQVLWRLPPGGRGPGQILLRCVQSMPGQREQAYNSCYSGGAFHLQRGEGLRLAVPRANASLDLTPHGTFLGLVRL